MGLGGVAATLSADHGAIPLPDSRRETAEAPRTVRRVGMSLAFCECNVERGCAADDFVQAPAETLLESEGEVWHDALEELEDLEVP